MFTLTRFVDVELSKENPVDLPDIALPRMPASAATQIAGTPGSASGAGDNALRAAAAQFETAFVAEMLKHTGVGKMTEGFNGGAGEAAFSGFLTWEYAEEVTTSGAFGLADRIYQSLTEK
jgi:Rod binding domain-containing protein